MSLEWFKFYTKPFITDTLRLSTEAKGAYLMLILDYYDQGKPAPDDDDTLATITGLSIETWRRHRRVIEPLFNVRDGLWHHDKCAQVLAEAATSYQQKVDAANAAVEARKRKKQSRGKPGGSSPGQPTDTPSGQSNGAPDGQRSVEANFGPSDRSLNRTVDRTDNRTVNRTVNHPVKIDGTEPDGIPDGQPLGAPDGQPDEQQNRRIEESLSEGASAPSGAGVGFSLGTTIPPNFMPASEVIGDAIRIDGIRPEDLSSWLDDWKQRCLDDGTRVSDWHAAWAREYDRRMKERAKTKPRPRVSVSKKRLERIPDGWQPNEGHGKIAAERNLDLVACVESFSDYIVNKRPDWRDADAAFRNWLKSPHRTEFKRNGQASQRRAPAPGGSILDAGARFEQRIDAATGRSPEEDQPHGNALVLGVPEE